MKAIVKKTNAVVDVYPRVVTSLSGNEALKYIDKKSGCSYFEEELCFPKHIEDEHDYWEILKHNATIEMLGSLIITNDIKNGDLEGMRECITNAMAMSHALIERMKTNN